MFKKLAAKFSKSLTLWVLLLLLILFLSNFILGSLNLNFDATSDRKYTLSKNTETFLKGLQNNIDIKFYYSKTNTSVPAPLKQYADRITGLMQQFEQAAKGKISLQILNPKPDTDEEEVAITSGISPNQFNSENFFIGAVLSSGQKDSVIGYFDPSREKFFEYDLARVIYDLTVEKKNTLGILSRFSGNGLSLPYKPEQPTEYFASQLYKFFDARFLIPDQIAVIPDDIETLLVIHPEGFPIQAEYAIEQYILKGGNVAILYDPYFRNDPTLATRGNNQRQVSTSSLDRLFKKWKVETHETEILADRKYATLVGTANGQVPYTMWFTGTPEALNKDLPISANVNEFIFQEAGGFTIDGNPDIKVVPIVTSSPQTSYVNPFSVLFGNPLEITVNLPYDQGQKYIMAYLSGKFESAFDSAPEATEQEKSDPIILREVTTRPAQIKSSESAGRVLLISDVDFISDVVSVSKGSFLGQELVQQRNDNLNLFFASLIDLQSDKTLALIQPRAVTNRPFTTFSRMQIAAQAKYQNSEESLKRELASLQQSLKEIKPQEGSSKLEISPEQLAQVKAYQVQEVAARKELRNTRKLLREDIELLITWLTIFNVLLVPILMAAIGVLVYTKRAKRNN